MSELWSLNLLAGPVLELVLPVAFHIVDGLGSAAVKVPEEQRYPAVERLVRRALADRQPGVVGEHGLRENPARRQQYLLVSQLRRDDV